MSLSDELRDELAAIAPRRRCCSPRRAVGALPLRRSRGTCAATASSPSTSTSRARPPRAAPSALLRDLGVRSEIRTYRRRAFDRATRYQLHVEVDAARRRGAARGGRALGARRAARAPAEARRRPLVLPRRLPARRAARRRLALRARATPHLELRAREHATARALLAEIAAREGIALATLERRTHAVAYAKSTRDDRRPPRGRRRERDRAPPRRARRHRRHASRGEPPRERRRGEREAHGRRGAESSSRRSSSSTSTASRRSSREIATLRVRHPSLSLAELAQKCRPPITKAAAHHRMAMLAASRSPDAGTWPTDAAARMAGRRGSSEDDLPLRLNHAPDRWRRTGSESGAGRAWTRRGEYLQFDGGRSRGFASRTPSRTRGSCARLHCREREIRRAAGASGRDQRPRPRRRDPRVGPADDDAAARRAPSARSSSRRSAASRTRSSRRPRSAGCSTSSAASSRSTSTTRSRRA